MNGKNWEKVANNGTAFLKFKTELTFRLIQSGDFLTPTKKVYGHWSVFAPQWP